MREQARPEAAMIVVHERVLCCMCGAFSDKWLEVARRCGKEAEPLQVNWGRHIDQREIDRALNTGKFDAVTLIHNETSSCFPNLLGTPVVNPNWDRMAVSVTMKLNNRFFPGKYVLAEVLVFSSRSSVRTNHTVGRCAN